MKARFENTLKDHVTDASPRFQEANCIARMDARTDELSNLRRIRGQDSGSYDTYINGTKRNKGTIDTVLICRSRQISHQ